MLQASKQWKWIACPTQNRLLVDLDQDMQLCTPYKLRQLTDYVLAEPCFSLEDAAFYQQVYQYLDGFNLWQPAQLCQIALNATAAKFHLKPVLAKSWFFQPYTGVEPSVEAVIKLQSRIQCGEFLIIDHSEDASLCICLSEHYQLDENLSLNQFEVIRVLNNRVHPIYTHAQNSKTA
ncbi:cell division protein ZapC [Pseudoalteromonas shioyasakiensis]|uniref:cell division protein ZapC domain-containing protein n=1 Tax=Pseudoalteromonas shioyasakiensis TaxID=1190813 RepID=UPI00211834AB|nr:cell division protein ZapC domain-containing protein [Pseudoalteromonas shioyasakiensis]MCQ8876841.1 cell division protein ZapC [Pseudoalteromonas shioyasakiensis]